MRYINDKIILMVRAVALCFLVSLSFDSYAMHTPYVAIPVAPEDSNIQAPKINNFIPPAFFPPAQNLTRSTSHQTFHVARKPKNKRKKLSQKKLPIMPSIIKNAVINSDVSINTSPVTSQPKKGGCKNTIREARACIQFAMTAAMLYMVIQLVNKAELIAGNTESLNQEGKEIEGGVAIIAGGVTAVENIVGYLWNLTRSGW